MHSEEAAGSALAGGRGGRSSRGLGRRSQHRVREPGLRRRDLKDQRDLKGQAAMPKLELLYSALASVATESEFAQDMLPVPCEVASLRELAKNAPEVPEDGYEFPHS